MAYVLERKKEWRKGTGDSKQETGDRRQKTGDKTDLDSSRKLFQGGLLHSGFDLLLAALCAPYAFDWPFYLVLRQLVDAGVTYR